MPELPEIYSACRLINATASKYVFGGKIEKSKVSKNCEVDWHAEIYKIDARSRGKELMVSLQRLPIEEKKLDSISILFHFGMSGVFRLSDASNIPKHSHLRFYTVNTETPKALNFIDVRRFGGWKLTNEWTPDRGPDPVHEYSLFRKNVLDNLNDKAFNKPICETLLNQKYFNGIGNYLRAEILYRAKIKPFEEARSVLQGLNDIKNEIKKETPDILELCHDVPSEALNIDTVSVYDPESKKEDSKAFFLWLKCYYNKEMKTMLDHNKRTIWFEGEAGPLAPKNSKSKKMTKPKKSNIKQEKTEKDDSKLSELTISSSKPSKRKTQNRDDNLQVKKEYGASDTVTKKKTSKKIEPTTDIPKRVTRASTRNKD